MPRSRLLAGGSAFREAEWLQRSFDLRKSHLLLGILLDLFQERLAAVNRRAFAALRADRPHAGAAPSAVIFPLLHEDDRLAMGASLYVGLLPVALRLCLVVEKIASAARVGRADEETHASSAWL